MTDTPSIMAYTDLSWRTCPDRALRASVAWSATPYTSDLSWRTHSVITPFHLFFFARGSGSSPEWQYCV